MKGLQSADAGLRFPRPIPGHAVCLNAIQLQEQGCFILDQIEMNKKKALFVMVLMQQQKTAQLILFTELCKNKGMQCVAHFHVTQEEESEEGFTQPANQEAKSEISMEKVMETKPFI